MSTRSLPVWIGDVTWTPDLASSVPVREALLAMIGQYGGVAQPGRFDDDVCGSLQVRFETRLDAYEFIVAIHAANELFDDPLYESGVDIQDVQGWFPEEDRYTPTLTSARFKEYVRAVRAMRGGETEKK